MDPSILTPSTPQHWGSTNICSQRNPQLSLKGGEKIQKQKIVCEGYRPEEDAGFQPTVREQSAAYKHGCHSLHFYKILQSVQVYHHSNHTHLNPITATVCKDSHSALSLQSIRSLSFTCWYQDFWLYATVCMVTTKFLFHIFISCLSIIHYTSPAHSAHLFTLNL